MSTSGSLQHGGRGMPLCRHRRKCPTNPKQCDVPSHQTKTSSAGKTPERGKFQC